MSLSQLNTKDLTAQDHTLNLEAMQAPVRFQLLLKKHKALNKAIQRDRSFYDKEKYAIDRNFELEKRVMEKRMKKVSCAKYETTMTQLGQTRKVKRSTTATEKRYFEKEQNYRRCISETSQRASCDIQQHRRKNPRDKNLDDRKPSNGAYQYHLESVSHQCKNIKDGDQQEQVHIETSNALPNIAVPSLSETERIVFPKTSSVRFPEKLKSYEIGTEEYDLMNKIDKFLKEQKDFNKKQAQVAIKTHTDTVCARRPKCNEPMITKRYSRLALDMSMIYQAFDNFTMDDSLKEFQKIVKLASKLKLSQRPVRIQAIIPTLKCANEKY